MLGILSFSLNSITIEDFRPHNLVSRPSTIKAEMVTTDFRPPRLRFMTIYTTADAITYIRRPPCGGTRLRGLFP